MKWTELIQNQIDKLEKEKVKEIKKMDNIKNDDIGKFNQKIEIMINIKSINETISRLYIVLGEAAEVTE